MGALGHYLESQGIATTQISLVREHTSTINPPRALWVPFMLGRPFGAPGDAAFQRRVLVAALNLLAVKAGPVLVDWMEDAPAVAGDAGPLACPVSFARAQGDDLAAKFLHEVGELGQWHDLACARRGRTTVGLSGLAIPDAARFVASYLGEAPQAPWSEELAAGEALKLACEDLRAYYSEAAAAQPGAPDAVAVRDWFWHDTAAGRVLQELQRVCLASEDASLRLLAERSLVPRAVERAGAPRPPAESPA